MTTNVISNRCQIGTASLLPAFHGCFTANNEAQRRTAFSCSSDPSGPTS